MATTTFNTDKPVNGYKCGNGHVMIVRDVDKGTTPMLIRCRMCEDHNRVGFAESMGYLVPAHWWGMAEWEFYKPANPGHFEGPMRAHIDKGGLVLRKVGEPDESLGSTPPSDTITTTFHILQDGKPVSKKVTMLRETLLLYNARPKEKWAELYQMIVDEKAYISIEDVANNN